MTKPWVFLFAATLLTFSHFAGAQEMFDRHPEEYTRVTNQRSTLQCWAVTSVARFELDASRIYGKPLKISARYLVYTKTLLEVVHLILNHEFEPYEGLLSETGTPQEIYYEQGGFHADSLEALRRFGAMPDVTADFEEGLPETDEDLFVELNKVIKRYHKKYLKNKRSKFSMEDVEYDVRKVLNKYLGKPPEKFEFEGRAMTAQEFADIYLKDLYKSSGRELNFHPTIKAKTFNLRVAGVRTLRMPYTNSNQEMIDLLSESLKRGDTPTLGYQMVDYHKTQRHGHIGFKINGETPPDWKTFDYDNGLDHYVLALRGEWSRSGKLLRVLVKNTFQTGAANNYGFHWMHADYFPLIESVELTDNTIRPSGCEGLLTKK